MIITWGEFMKKDTNELLKELKNFDSFQRFYKENSENISAVSLSEYLEKLIKEKGLNKAEIVKKSEMSEVYTYQIISGIREKPKREKVLCLAIGMGLTCDETQELLKKTGYAPLYAKNPFDAIIIYGIAKGMGVVEINNLLFEYEQETLG